MIKIIFKIIGAAAASAKRLWEFNIAEKKDDKETSNKNGKVILVRSIAKLIFSMSPTNPGAINVTNIGMNICTKITIANKLKNNKLKTSLAKLFDLFLPLTNSEEQLGTKAALKVPSENSLLKVFGILNATKKTSAKKLVPRNIAIKISLR